MSFCSPGSSATLYSCFLLINRQLPFITQDIVSSDKNSFLCVSAIRYLSIVLSSLITEARLIPSIVSVSLVFSLQISIKVGATSIYPASWPVTRGLLPGMFITKGVLCPPSNTFPFTPRIPALYPLSANPVFLSSLTPPAVPLSVQKITIVFLSIFRFFNVDISIPKFSSIFVIIP